MALGIIGNVYVGEMETGNFTFQAIGDEVKDVKRRLAIGFQTHLHQYHKYEAQQSGSKTRWDNSPSAYKKVRRIWAEETSSGDCSDFDAWIHELEEYYGFRINKYVHPTDVMRDGSKL